MENGKIRFRSAIIAIALDFAACLAIQQFGDIVFGNLI
jgi:hypothetical protein